MPTMGQPLCWGHNDEQNRHGPCLYGVFILVQEDDIGNKLCVTNGMQEKYEWFEVAAQ